VKKILIRKYKIICLILLISLFCVGVYICSNKSKDKINDKESVNHASKAVKTEKLVINTSDVCRNGTIIIYNNGKVVYSVTGEICVMNKNNETKVVVYINTLDK